MQDVEGGAGSRVFERVIVITVPLSIWLILGFLLEGLIEGTLPRVLHLPSVVIHLALLAALFGAVAFAVRALRQGSPSFLASPVGYSAGEALLPIGRWSLVAYVAVGTLLGAAAYALVSKTDEHWALVVYGFATWVPLWFAVPIGAIIAWHRVRRASARVQGTLADAETILRDDQRGVEQAVGAAERRDG